MSEVQDPSVSPDPVAAAGMPGTPLPPDAVVPPEVREAEDAAEGSEEIDDVIDAEISAEINADIAVTETAAEAAGPSSAAVPVPAAPAQPAAATAEKAGEATEDKGDTEAIDALKKLSSKLFSRMCRRVPLRTFMAELERLDRAVFFRHFKGYRPSKIDANHLEKVLRAEIFDRGNSLLAQLVIYNWDEAEYRLYGQLQKHVKEINEDVEAIEQITDAQADPIMDALESEFDKRDVYIGAVINGVRVSDAYLEQRFAAVR